MIEFIVSGGLVNNRTRRKICINIHSIQNLYNDLKKDLIFKIDRFTEIIVFI